MLLHYNYQMQVFPCVTLCLSGVYSSVVVSCIPAYLETAIDFVA